MHLSLQLWERLMGQRLGPGRALAALEQLFSGGGDQPHGGRACMTLLVVDEIDVLITKDQSVCGGGGSARVCVCARARCKTPTSATSLLTQGGAH
eukprot:scaffold11321_cov22-Tisochrysis_lutea.AAC.1